MGRGYEKRWVQSQAEGKDPECFVKGIGVSPGWMWNIEVFIGETPDAQYPHLLVGEECTWTYKNIYFYPKALGLCIHQTVSSTMEKFLSEFDNSLTYKVSLPMVGLW